VYKRQAEYKATAERWETYAAEKKEANKGKTRITIAHLKSFLKKNETNIYVKVCSRFDGMQDMVDYIENPTFSKVEYSENTYSNALGFAGVYCVGSSRDTISIYEDDNLTGYHVYNCCGSFTVATAKQPVKTEAPQPTTPTTETTSPTIEANEIQVIDYSEKAIAVTGNFSKIYNQLIALGGAYNSRLKCGKGIIFSKKKQAEVLQFLSTLQPTTPPPAEAENKTVLALPAPITQVVEAMAETTETVDTTTIKSPLQSFVIVWHEGVSIYAENTIFHTWTDAQQALLNIWRFNDLDKVDKGYTKVKVCITWANGKKIVDRVDLGTYSGDFNPTLQNIGQYLEPQTESYYDSDLQIGDRLNMLSFEDATPPPNPLKQLPTIITAKAVHFLNTINLN
jgi:hypothetical protein